jgi:hypothetical protein
MDPDITVFDNSRQAVLIVEVKARTGTSKEWASLYRRNLAAHGSLPKVPYFLIATPDHFSLWKNPPNGAIATNPDYDIDATEVLEPYYRRSNIDSRTVMGRAFELIVAAWLHDVQEGIVADGVVRPSQHRLGESGILEALRGGRLILEPTAP